MPDPTTVALVSVISSGAVGTAGVLVAGLGGWRQRVHDRTMKQEDRRQERLEETYLALVSFVERRIRQVDAIRPIVEPHPKPPEITAEEIQRVYSLVKLHASTEVSKLLDEFNDVGTNVHTADFAMRMLEDARKLGRSVEPKTYGVEDEVNQHVRLPRRSRRAARHREAAPRPGAH